MSIFAQIKQGVYLLEDGNIRHELKLNSHYFIHTVYEKSPAEFIKSVGGFYTIQKNTIKVILEFNSAFQKDSLRTLNMPILVKEGNLILGDESKMIFKPQESNTQDLDGQWLFATRGPDKGQERRGESNTRKTLKFLKDGYFQWIAYNTESMQFKGTGGGSYTSLDGIYTEHIEFFSRDNSRVEESLKFNYEIKGDDWHHTGKNSKDEPMYEIWGRRGLSE
jgi:hypothetical protein